jgi:membrane protease YdiL (CAAX protease family)
MMVWGLVATLGFAILAFGLGQAVGIGALLALKSIDPQRVDYDGTAIAIVTLIANPVPIVTLVLAVRLAGADVLAYFGLKVPRWRDVTIAVSGLAVVIVVADLLTLMLGRDLIPAFQFEIQRSAQADGTFAWLLLALIVIAPIGEEMLFRGFLYRGLVHGPRDVLPGIIAIALIWSLLHIQYDWFGIGLIFVIGMLFGYVRHHTGSTTLVILLHMLMNFESVVETALVSGP